MDKEKNEFRCKYMNNKELKKEVEEWFDNYDIDYKYYDDYIFVERYERGYALEYYQITEINLPVDKLLGCLYDRLQIY